MIIHECDQITRYILKLIWLYIYSLKSSSSSCLFEDFHWLSVQIMEFLFFFSCLLQVMQIDVASVLRWFFLWFSLKNTSMGFHHKSKLYISPWYLVLHTTLNVKRNKNHCKCKWYIGTEKAHPETCRRVSTNKTTLNMAGLKFKTRNITKHKDLDGPK
jgi:hypothetical protein